MCLLIVAAFVAFFGMSFFQISDQDIRQDIFEAFAPAIVEEGAVVVGASENVIGASSIFTLPSGLQYEVIREGTGARPTAADSVTVHYTGMLIDGAVFDSSVERGEPATFPLSGVIAGWTEGVQLMTIGSIYRFTMPPELAYGAAGRPPVIPAKSTLIFVIELLGIQE